MNEMIQRSAVAYAWGIKREPKALAHCFVHVRTKGFQATGREPWTSICSAQHQTQDIGWTSAGQSSPYRRAKPVDKKCTACLKKIDKLDITV